VNLLEIVAGKLILNWSPEQIAGWLKNKYPNDESMRESHETIYRILFIQACGVLKKSRFSIFNSSGGSAACGMRGIVDTAAARSPILFPFEKGLRKSRTAPFRVVGRATSLATPRTATSPRWWNVNRVSRRWSNVSSKKTATMVSTLSRHVRKLPASLWRSLAWDRGLEMAQHKTFTVDTNVKVYFCDPKSPWRRGSNENTNGFLR
jgi:IS30 family transposase